MLVLLAGLFVVHIATAIMLFVSTIANVSSIPLFTHPREGSLEYFGKMLRKTGGGSVKSQRNELLD